MAGDVGGDIVLLELGQRLAAFAQHGGDALCRAVFSQFVEQRLACGFGLLHPVVTGLQDHFGLRQVGRGAAQFADQFQQAFDAGEHVEILLLEFDVLRRDAQVLELADGVVGRERFGELLERIQPRIPVLGFFVAQQVLAPEAELALLKVGTGLKHTRHQCADCVLQPPDRLLLPLSGFLRQTWRQPKQFEQRA